MRHARSVQAPPRSEPPSQTRAGRLEVAQLEAAALQVAKVHAPPRRGISRFVANEAGPKIRYEQRLSWLNAGFEAALALVVALPTAAPEALAAGMIGYRLVLVVLVLIANQLLGHPPSAPCCSQRATWRATASSCAASRPWKTSAALSSSAPTRPAP